MLYCFALNLYKWTNFSIRIIEFDYVEFHIRSHLMESLLLSLIYYRASSRQSVDCLYEFKDFFLPILYTNGETN